MRTALLLVLVTACSSGATQQNRIVDDADARKLLVERNWITDMPETERDHFHVYRFVPSMGGGVFQDRTIFKGTFELFQFETAADEIRFNLLETHDKVVSKFHIEEVDGPAPFDLKLTIHADPRGPQVYYGIRAEHDPDGSKLDARIAKLRLKK
jgi:hypothetical protein